MPFDLKPCPFCGGTAIWNEYEALDPPLHYRAGYVKCSVCECRTRDYTLDGYYGSTDKPEDAVSVWNQRQYAESKQYGRSFIGYGYCLLAYWNDRFDKVDI